MWRHRAILACALVLLAGTSAVRAQIPARRSSTPQWNDAAKPVYTGPLKIHAQRQRETGMGIALLGSRDERTRSATWRYYYGAPANPWWFSGSWGGWWGGWWGGGWSRWGRCRSFTAIWVAPPPICYDTRSSTNW